MALVTPRTQQQYLEELEKKLTLFEQLRDRASGLDERIDVTNRLLIETVRLLTEGMVLQLPGVPVSPTLYRRPAVTPPELPYYNVRKYLLDTARTEPGEEVDVPGDMITAYTDGTMDGTFIRLEETTSDAIPLNEFNPYKYIPGFKKFWLETTAQAGKYLRLHIGRGAMAEALVQVTATAPKQAFQTIRSDKDSHFTGGLAQNAKEDENLTGILSNKIRIVGISLQSDQQLHYKVLFWKTDGFDDSDLDVDTFCGEVDVDLAIYGIQIGGANQWYLDVRGVVLDYEDEDASNELHVSLLNKDATSKNAGATGECVLDIYYEIRT